MQEVVKWLAVGSLAFIVGCKTVPVLDFEGNPTGEEARVVDPRVAEPIETAVEVVAPMLPPPWNLVASAAVALVAGIRIRRKTK